MRFDSQLSRRFIRAIREQLYLEIFQRSHVRSD